MMRVVFAGLMLAACASAPADLQTEPTRQGKAAEADEPAKVVFSRWTLPEDCAEADTISVPLRTLLSRPERYRGKCISTTGYFADRAMAPLRNSLDYNLGDRRADGKRVGLYGSDEVMELVFSKENGRAQVVGKLWDCGDLYGPNVIMVLGYCHYTGGPFIALASFKPIG